MKSLELFRIFFTSLIILILVFGCQDEKPRYCYKVVDAISDRKKDLIPYTVNDTNTFVDNNRNYYYLVCSNIIDTKENIRDEWDFDCIGERYIVDKYFRYYIFETNIPLVDSCNQFNLSLSNTQIGYIKNPVCGKRNKFEKINFVNFRLEINELVKNDKKDIKIPYIISSNDDTIYYNISYIDSLRINNKLYYEIFKLPTLKEKESPYNKIDFIFVNEEFGFLRFALKDRVIDLVQ